MQRYPKTPNRRLRPAGAVVFVAISLALTLGIAALAVDLGVLYQAQAELQRAADAAALAATEQLIVAQGQDSGEPDGADPLDPLDAATYAAGALARINTVIREEGALNAETDIEFGRAVYMPAIERFEFQPSSEPYDSVRVTVRRTEGNSSGPIDLIFAKFLGHDTRDLQARAAAVLVPRDIAVVIDLSGSMTYDSELRYWDRNDGGYANTRDIWAALDGWEPSRPYLPGSELETEYASDTGPDIGAMSDWGDPLLPGSYDPGSDDGLWYIRRNSVTTDSNLLSDLTARGYTNDEINAMTSSSNDGDNTLWRNRVGVMVGLATWKSGKTGALYPGGGDGDNLVESSEVSWIVYPGFRVDWSWSNYIDEVENGNGVPGDFRYRYGLKTFTNWLMERQSGIADTNNLWATPEQPLRAVKDAVQSMIDVIEALDSLDHVSLEIFAQTARHEIDLTDNLQAVPDRLYHMQAGHYDRMTNIGGGLAQAIAELQSSRARGNTHKVIVLMSDGVPNMSEDGSSDAAGARVYALNQAERAADFGYRVYTVSVGYSVDRALMQEIAALGQGQEFYAVGAPEEYSEQLQEIFRTLGGRRSVTLIE